MNIDSSKDLRGPAIVVRGSVIRGFRFHGPFRTVEDAYEWCNTKTLDAVLGRPEGTVVLLENPNVDCMNMIEKTVDSYLKGNHEDTDGVS